MNLRKKINMLEFPLQKFELQQNNHSHNTKKNHCLDSFIVFYSGDISVLLYIRTVLEQQGSELVNFEILLQYKLIF